MYKWLNMNEKQVEEMRGRQYANKMYCARLISDQYPSIKEIRIEYKTSSLSWEGAERVGSQCYYPNDRAIFLVGCPNSTCTGIGFDLDNEVWKLAQSGRQTCRGSLRCENYEDAERYNKHRCGSTLEYSITIEYQT